MDPCNFAARQFVLKVTGARKPSKTDQAVLDKAVANVTPRWKREKPASIC